MQGKIQPVVIAVIRKKNKYLLTFRTDTDPKKDPNGIYRAWQFPGGSIEFNESTEECLHRECIEEVGVDVNILALLPKIFHDVHLKYWHGVFITYICELKNPSAKIVLNEEASDYCWVTAKEAKKLKKLPKTQPVLNEAEKFFLK